MIYTLILKVAERCNLNCSYCYMYQHGDNSFLTRPKFMSDDVFSNVLRRMRDYCELRPTHKMQINLHGGEPTLLGVERLDAMASMAKRELGPRLAGIVMQSNGTLIDEACIEVLKKHNIQTSISIDGPAHIHNLVRVDHRGQGSHDAVMRGLHLLQATDLFGGVICVINPARSGVECYRFLRSEGVKRMNFLFPDVTHETKASLYGDFGETPVADYLIPVFDEWYNEDDPDVRVRFFWSLVRLILGGRATVDSLGNPRMSYLIIESDGSIQALDTLRICEEGLPDTGLNVATHGFDDLEMGSPLAHKLVHQGIPCCAICRNCSEHATCGGGYIAHRYSRHNGFDNPSAWCADILKLFQHVRHAVGINHAMLSAV